MIGIRQVLVGVLVSLLAPVVDAAADPIAPFIFAEFQPGGTCDDCFGWRITVFADGTVTQEVKRDPGWGTPEEWSTRRSVHLSKRRLEHLRSSIVESRFSSLRGSYSAGYDLPNGGARIVTDQDTDIVSINLDGKITRVSVYGPERIAGLWAPEDVHPDREDGRCFIALWAEILDIVRPPNSWQKARHYGVEACRLTTG